MFAEELWGRERERERKRKRERERTLDAIHVRRASDIDKCPRRTRKQPEKRKTESACKQKFN